MHMLMSQEASTLAGFHMASSKAIGVSFLAPDSLLYPALLPPTPFVPSPVPTSYILSPVPGNLPRGPLGASSFL